jgi:hypothetical protein
LHGAFKDLFRRENLMTDDTAEREALVKRLRDDADALDQSVHNARVYALEYGNLLRSIESARKAATALSQLKTDNKNLAAAPPPTSQWQTVYFRQAQNLSTGRVEWMECKEGDAFAVRFQRALPAPPTEQDKP